MTVTDAPEPPDEESARDQSVKAIAGWNLDPGSLHGLKAALTRSTEQATRGLSPSMKAFVDSGKITRVEPSQVRNLDPEHPPKGETAQDVQNQLVEMARQQLDATTEVNAFLKQKAEDEVERATESEKHAKASKVVAIVSAGIALFALFGALPQGIAALPDAWAVITGGWPPAPPSP